MPVAGQYIFKFKCSSYNSIDIHFNKDELNDSPIYYKLKRHTEDFISNYKIENGKTTDNIGYIHIDKYNKIHYVTNFLDVR